MNARKKDAEQCKTELLNTILNTKATERKRMQMQWKANAMEHKHIRTQKQMQWNGNTMKRKRNATQTFLQRKHNRT